MNKIHRIVEYIRSCCEICFDTDDVIERLNDILTANGICSALKNDEYYIVMEELLDLAEKSEICEAVRWANWQLECGSVSGIDYRVPGYI